MEGKAVINYPGTGSQLAARKAATQTDDSDTNIEAA